MKNKKNLVEIFGWYGITAILTAYGLISYGIIESDELVYQLLNFTGALGVIAVSLAKHNKQPAVLNIVWAVIALAAIIRIISG